jgi:hypothetical protein
MKQLYDDFGEIRVERTSQTIAKRQIVVERWAKQFVSEAIGRENRSVGFGDLLSYIPEYLFQPDRAMVVLSRRHRVEVVTDYVAGEPKFIKPLLTHGVEALSDCPQSDTDDFYCHHRFQDCDRLHSRNLNWPFPW